MRISYFSCENGIGGFEIEITIEFSGEILSDFSGWFADIIEACGEYLRKVTFVFGVSFDAD